MLAKVPPSCSNTEALSRGVNNRFTKNLWWAGADLFDYRLDQRSGVAPSVRNFLALSDRSIFSAVAHHTVKYEPMIFHLLQKPPRREVQVLDYS